MSQDLHLGDRFDVMLDGRRCVSSLQEITPAGTMILSAPTYRSTPIMVEKGAAMSLSYYRASGMFTFTAKITRRYTEHEVPLIEAEISSPITKYQRRDFVRFEVVLPMIIKQIATSAEMHSMVMEKILRKAYDRRFADIINPESAKLYRGMTMDISGGGARISCSDALEVGSLTECSFALNEELHVTTDAEVLRCEPSLSGGSYPFQAGLKFANIEEIERKKIIRYIFAEQLKRKRKR